VLVGRGAESGDEWTLRVNIGASLRLEGDRVRLDERAERGVRSGLIAIVGGDGSR